MIRKISHMLIGWGKRLGILQTSSAEAKLAELRMKSCAACEMAKTKAILRFINGGAEEGNEESCSLCGCPVLEKTMVVDEKCPIGKW